MFTITNEIIYVENNPRKDLRELWKLWKGLYKAQSVILAIKQIWKLIVKRNNGWTKLWWNWKISYEKSIENMAQNKRCRARINASVLRHYLLTYQNDAWLLYMQDKVLLNIT